MMSRWTITTTVLAITSGLGAYTATVATRSASPPTAASPDDATNTLLAWLQADEAQRRELQGHDPAFQGDLERLRRELAAKRTELAFVLERPDASDEEIMVHVEATIAVSNALERRVAAYLLSIRDHLTPGQKRRFLGLCAEGLRQGGLCPCKRQRGPAWSSRPGETSENDCGREGHGRGRGLGYGRGPTLAF